MESMRKTKASTDKKNVAAKEKDKDLAKSKSEKPVKGKSKKARKKITAKVDAGSSVDPYQSGQRIWPD
jgi:hypothetical protein